MAEVLSPEQQIRELGQWKTARVTGPAERILAEAFVLFYSDGIRAVGIDLLIDRAGVAKASFYRHFPSKEALIVAYLERRNEAFMGWLANDVARRAETPGDRLLAIFDSLADLFADPDFEGCPVIKAICEVGKSPPILERARDSRAQLQRYIRELAAGAGLTDPEQVAAEWVLLIDGALANSQREGGPVAAATARHLAATVLPRRASP